MSAVVDEPGSAGKATVSRDAGRALAAGVMILAAILFFARLGARALWSSEFRWAEIAREMRLTGNYFWPTINGRLYYDKPLASYWLVLWAADLTGAHERGRGAHSVRGRGAGRGGTPDDPGAPALRPAHGGPVRALSSRPA